MKGTRGVIVLAIAAGTLAMADASQPPQPQGQPPRSLDEQLLDELGADPLEEPEQQPSEPADGQGGAGGQAGQRPEDLSQRLKQELGAAAVAEEDNPLLEVARRMHEVEGRIAQSDSGPGTRGLQERIVADLEELIRQARKACQGGSGGNPSASRPGGQPKSGTGGTRPNTRPASTSTPRTDNGEGRGPDRQQMQTLVREVWKVALPPQQRSQLPQSPFDEFLPKYERMIEQYYRRLAREGEEPPRGAE